MSKTNTAAIPYSDVHPVDFLNQLKSRLDLVTVCLVESDWVCDGELRLPAPLVDALYFSIASIQRDMDCAMKTWMEAE